MISYFKPIAKILRVISKRNTSVKIAFAKSSRSASLFSRGYLSRASTIVLPSIIVVDRIRKVVELLILTNILELSLL